MDEPKRKVDSEASGVAASDRQADGVGQGRRESLPARIGSDEGEGRAGYAAPSRSGESFQTRESRPQPELKRPSIITAKQKALYKEYLSNGHNKRQAYLKVYKKKDAKPGEISAAFKTAGMLFLMAGGKIEAAKRVQDVFDKAGITQERVMEELAKVGFHNVRNLMEWGPNGVEVKESRDVGDASAAVAEVTEVHSKTGKSVKIKTHDKVAALVKIGQQLGMFQDKREDIGPRMAVQFIIRKD